MRRQFQKLEDPGHGWLKVTVAELEKLGIADKITSYSYQRGHHVYLEEDQDMSTFMQAYKAFFGRDINYRSKHTNRRSRVRGYPSYNQAEFRRQMLA